MGYLATLTLARGRLAGLIATAGVAAGLMVHAVVAAAGAGAVIQRYPAIYEILRWIGVGYLFYLAWKGWRIEAERPDADGNSAAEAGSLFGRGFLSNLFNPKSILFFVSVVPNFVTSAPGDLSPPLQMGLLGVTYVAIATGVHASIVMLAGQLRPWLVEGAHRNSVRRILSLALAGVAIWLAWTTRRA